MIAKPPPTESSDRAASKMATDDDRNALVIAARGGSVGALKQLVELLACELWRELHSRRQWSGNKPSNGTSDHLQETLCRLEATFGRFSRSTYGEFKHWGRAIRRKVELEYWRNRRTQQNERHLREIENRMLSRVDDRLTLDQTNEGVTTYLERLRRHERNIVELHVCGKTYREIAEAIGSKPDAVRKVFYRAIARIREMMESDGAL